MKINEIGLHNVIGDVGAAAFRSKGQPGTTIKSQMIQDIFIKDFVGDAATSLNNGIKGGLIDPNAKSTIPTESRYDMMNHVLESIININEETELRTISDFMMDWFAHYMYGVNWESSKTVVQQNLKKLQDEYPKNVKENLTTLARVGLALISVNKGRAPAGAPPEFTKAQQQELASVEKIKTELDNLSKSNPQAYNELVRALNPINITG